MREMDQRKKEKERKQGGQKSGESTACECVEEEESTNLDTFHMP